MTVVYWTLSFSLLRIATVVALSGQSLRSLRVRRETAANRQALLHSSSAVHVASVRGCETG